MTKHIILLWLAMMGLFIYCLYVVNNRQQEKYDLQRLELVETSPIFECPFCMVDDLDFEDVDGDSPKA